MRLLDRGIPEFGNATDSHALKSELGTPHAAEP
jgi:hypothetical protein